MAPGGSLTLEGVLSTTTRVSAVVDDLLLTNIKSTSSLFGILVASEVRGREKRRQEWWGYRRAGGVCTGGKCGIKDEAIEVF